MRQISLFLVCGNRYERFDFKGKRTESENVNYYCFTDDSGTEYEFRKDAVLALIYYKKENKEND